MNFILSLYKKVQTILAAFFILCSFASCQSESEQAKETHTEVQATETKEAVVTDTAQKRPAPAFFIIPRELHQQRVWICEGSSSDVFHVKHDCPVLISCKGKGTFRNISIHRAIEYFGKYNCQTCSKALDHIFDEEMVR